MAFKNKLTNINPVAAGQTATITIGCGGNAPTMDKLQLTLGGTTFDATKVTGIRGFMNGREFYKEDTASEHNARRAYLGKPTRVGEIVLDFTESNARSAIEQNLSAVPLSLLQDCRFEVDIAGTAVAPTLKALMHFRAPTKNPFVKKQRKMTQGFSNAGEQIVYLPNGPAGGKLCRIWIHEGIPGNITDVELRARNAIGFEGSRAQIQNEQSDNLLVPQAGVFCLDFIADGNLAGFFDTSALSDVQLKLFGAAADTYRIFLEYLDPIGHL